MRTAAEEIPGSRYSIWIVEYAHIPDFPKSGLLYGRHNAGTALTPFCYALLRGEERTILIDTGHGDDEIGRARNATGGIVDWQPPEVTLGRIGIDPRSVDTIVLTHGHFDHAGNVGAFPNARIVVQEREINHILWAHSLPDHLRWLMFAYDAEHVVDLMERWADGGLTVIDGDDDVAPGVRAVGAPNTHTAGSQYVVVDDGQGERWVFAGDNVYLWENLEGEQGDGRMIPIGLASGSISECLMTMNRMLQVVDGDSSHVLPFHENLLWERFPSRCFEDNLHVAEVSLRDCDGSVVA